MAIWTDAFFSDSRSTGIKANLFLWAVMRQNFSPIYMYFFVPLDKLLPFYTLFPLD